MTHPEYGEVSHIGDGVRRIVAPNPGPMTHWGTNTWIVGEGEVAVIDPGPPDPAHLAALLAAIEGEEVTHILITHAHADHSPLARSLAEATGAEVLAFGPPESGRSDTMIELAASGQVGGGEGMDSAFAPDRTLSEGDRLSGLGWTIDVLHTPGHFAGHLAFRLGDTLFSGDHVMDWSTSLVSPPDGDLAAFMETSARLAALGVSRCLTGHGGAVDDPADRLSWLIAHRKAREAAILNALGLRAAAIPDITAKVYTDAPPEMLPAAARNVFAHLIDLTNRKLVVAEPKLSVAALYRLA